MMKLYLNSKTDAHSAIAEYDGVSVTVLKGSKINLAVKYPQLPKYILNQRNDDNLVSSTGIVLRDVTFNSPTAAAQFVTGRSTNGYIAWRPNNNMSLKEYIATKKHEV